MVQMHPEYNHVAVGLSPAAREYAEMYLDAAFTILKTKDFLKLLAGSALCIDMHPYRSMGRVVLEAASLGVPVLTNRTPTCRVPTWKWYDGLNAGHGPVQAEAVKKHWIREAKADLDLALN
jgi:glycosyltransferase involved in cell wall biosynthesis